MNEDENQFSFGSISRSFNKSKDLSGSNVNKKISNELIAKFRAN